MSSIEIYNEDCFDTMNRLKEGGRQIDVVLTSPPYNTSRCSFTEKSRERHDSRYDVYADDKTAEEYCEWCVKVFNMFDKILSADGVVLWNVSYGTDTKQNGQDPNTMWLTIADIIRNTPFIVADRIIWKKRSALPNNTSSNRLTRIVEDVFVFCRETESTTFYANKPISRIGTNGQTYYKCLYNFIEAPNNDEVCNLNKATFSSDLCKQLLNMYATTESVVYDPFMGTGTTAVACKMLGMGCIGSELSAQQCEWAKKRLGETNRDPIYKKMSFEDFLV